MERRHQSGVAAGGVMWWQLCVCIHLSHQFSMRLSVTLPPGVTFVGQTHTTWSRTGPVLMTSSRRLRGDDGVMTCMRTTLCFYLGVCERAHSPACHRATVTPLLLHHARFTAKHPHRSVWAYLWGDCKMSMEFWSALHRLENTQWNIQNH